MMEEQKQRSNWRRPIAGPQRPGAAKRVAVYGSSPEPAYTRSSVAQMVTFTCVMCGRERTEYRYPGFKPRYCGQSCTDQAAAERNAKRVAAQREKRQKVRAARAQAAKPG